MLSSWNLKRFAGPGWLPVAAGSALLAVLYFAAGFGCLRLSFGNALGTPIWPSAGIGVGLLLLFGWRLWPGVLAGSLALNLQNHHAWPVAIGIAAGCTLEALTANGLLRRFADFRNALSRVKDAAALILIAGVLASLVSAFFGLGALLLGGEMPAVEKWRHFVTWWAGDLLGILVIVPVLLAWTEPARPIFIRQRLGEAALLFFGTLGGAWLVFCHGQSGELIRTIPFCLFPLIIWAALRFGPRAASASVLIISSMAVWGTLNGLGCFGSTGGSLTGLAVLLLQAFIGVGAVVSLLLSATSAELFEGSQRLLSSELRYRQLFDTNPDSMWVHDKHSGEILAVNEQAILRFGYSRREFESMTMLDLLPEKDSGPTARQALLEARARKSAQLRTKNGQLINVLIISRPLDFTDRECILLLAEDVTDRLRTENDLRRSEQTLELHIQQTAVGVIEWDENFCVSHWNPAAEKMFGYSEQEARGKPAVELIVPSDVRPDVQVLWQDLKKGESKMRHVNDNVTKDGLRITCEWFNTPLKDRDGNVCGVASLVQDITSRESAEETIRESEEKFRSIVESSPMGIQIYEVQGKDKLVLIGSNTAAENFMGAKNELVLGKTIEQAFPALAGTDIPRLYLRAAVEGKASWTDQVIYNGPDFRGAYEVNAFQTVPGKMVAMFLDVTERRRTEQALRLRDKAMEAISQGIVILENGPDGSLPIIYANPAFEKISGFTLADLSSKSWRALTGPESETTEVQSIEKAFSREQSVSVEMKSYHLDGSTFQSSISISPILDAEGKVTHFVGVYTDVSGIKRLETQFRQSQKMDAIGRLAGGVAHDFNNLLTAIIGYNDLNLSQLDRNTMLGSNSAEIQKAAERAAGLTGQMLAFSRQQNLQPTCIEMNKVIGSMYSMLARLIGETIEIRTHLDEDLGYIRAGSSQMEQVILNMAINARDAMPGGGLLTIRTRNVTVMDDLFNEMSNIATGEYVLVSMSDTGTGMDEKTKEHLFEPFFTTKEKGKGTGLGLATCYGIITQSGGYVNVHTRVGRGTTFDIYFPRIKTETPSETGRSLEVKIVGGGETLLVVEDDPAVRPLTTNILRTLGYTVLEAGDGVEAQACLRQINGTHIDLLLTDVVMPKMGGKELADWMKRSHPATKILFASGYLENMLSREDIGEDEAFFLRKPFTAKTLAKKVRQVLDLELVP